MPLALAPHVLFYYDVTPKIAILLAGASLALVLAAFDLDSVRAFCGTAERRWFVWAIVVFLGATVLSSLFAAHPSLAWNGSNWRRFGGLTEIACVVAAFLLAASTRGRENRIIPIFCAVSAAGTIASLYGIAQYFGWDPLISPAAYEAGEGVFRIVRPPSTLGHSDYFAAFLLWPVFTGLGLVSVCRISRIPLPRGRGSETLFRWLGWTTVFLGAFAIVLSGSRGALLGLAAGVLTYGFLARPRKRIWVSAVAIALTAFVAFYASPAGARLRARAHWIGEDSAGGARLLLWRDASRMAATRPWTGFGPENFVAEFPKFQSVDLSKLYPDFYHESPHNMWLDTLTQQGILGLLAQIAIVLLALRAGYRASRKRPEMTAGLLAGLIAVLDAHQFAVFTAVNGFYFYLGCALLVTLEPLERNAVEPVRYRILALSGASAGAIYLLFVAFRLVSTDFSLASADRLLSAGKPRLAADAYRLALDRAASGMSAGVSANLYFSRRWAQVAGDSPDVLSKLYFGQLAVASASLATQAPEGGPNAWFNMAQMRASSGDSVAMENALRSSIAQSPNWFKPHWALARLLFLENRKEEAREESLRAIDLNQKDQEVALSLAPILSFRGVPGGSPTP
jgi:hypothetical protein